MNELIAIMMSWAVTLTGLPAAERAPQVQQVTAAYLSQAACQGRSCKVLGWFPPGDTIYVDERLDPQQNLFASSVLLHEVVHYLQQEAGRYDPHYSCENVMALEREAYQAQRDYLLRYGVYQPVGASMHAVGCELTAQAPVGH